MRVLIDISHPAHVHFYRHLVSELEHLGHSVAIVARDKEVTLALLDAFGLDHVTVGASGDKGLIGLGFELVERVTALRRIGRDFGADVILTRNPAGVQAARLLRIPGIFDTDDGREVGIHWKAAAPFAHYITMPDCITDDYRGKRVPYPSYKSLAFLHPDRFTPDRSVLEEAGIAPGERYFIARFVGFGASHDRSEAGMDLDVKHEVIARLSRHGRVLISSESELPESLAPHRFSLPPHRLHDALAFSSLVVGDSQSLAEESAVLGVPAIRYSSFSGRLARLRELEERYGLIFEYRLDAPEAFLDKVSAIARDGDRSQWQQRRERLLSEKVDLTTWYRDFVLRLTEPVPGE